MNTEDELSQPAEPHNELPHTVQLLSLGDLQSHGNPFTHERPKKGKPLPAIGLAKSEETVIARLPPKMASGTSFKARPDFHKVTHPAMLSVKSKSTILTFRDIPLLGEPVAKSPSLNSIKSPAALARIVDPTARVQAELSHDLFRLSLVSPVTAEEVAEQAVTFPSEVLTDESPRKTLFLDLDDTLVYRVEGEGLWSKGGLEARTIEYEDEVNSDVYMSKIILRPHAVRLLKELSELYEIIVWLQKYLTILGFHVCTASLRQRRGRPARPRGTIHYPQTVQE